jgi:hypothetical protein
MTNEEALEILDDNYTVLNTHGHYTEEEEVEALQMAVETLEQTRWIPVSERLPESDDEVLVTDDAGGLALVGIDWFDRFDSDGSRWWCSQNVTAWMPLPEPYRGGESE